MLNDSVFCCQRVNSTKDSSSIFVDHGYSDSLIQPLTILLFSEPIKKKIKRKKPVLPVLLTQEMSTFPPSLLWRLASSSLCLPPQHHLDVLLPRLHLRAHHSQKLGSRESTNCQTLSQSGCFFAGNNFCVPLRI